MGKFEEILRSATNFVEQHKGSWKHYEWIAFMTEVKKKGSEISYDLQNNIGTMLESLKEYLGYVTGSGKGSQTPLRDGHPLKVLSETAVNFINDTKGKWDHSAWEKFLSDLSKKGIDLSERTTSYIGNVLESVKTVYFLSPKEEPQSNPVKEESPLVKAVTREVVKVKPKEVMLKKAPKVLKKTSEKPKTLKVSKAASSKDVKKDTEQKKAPSSKGKKTTAKSK